ncbi:hypothetical protein E8E13_002311 [Curvularia kusanoi]|uniref:DNA endonuclease activator Ctp1 C-terminal domain-containing protein n=1 Tax=Curvularia kusanoi TaxID=90978 RepID=A0A9P4WAY5_CURKU|nr:hypothetical protein E8E13_002311 [Curvularia kusanoi]
MADFTAWVERNRALWTRVYDEVIAPDFETEWKKREEKYHDELKKKDEHQQLLFNHINEQIVKNARVVEENEKLEAELQERAESTDPLTNVDNAYVPATGLPEELHQELSEKYQELSKKYQDLSQKVKYLERKNSAVMQKNKDMKESVRAWQQYADRQRKVKVAGGVDGVGESRTSPMPRSDEILPGMPSSPRSVNTVRTPIQHANRGQSSPAPQVLFEGHAAYAAETREGEGNLPSDSATPRGPTTSRLNKRQENSRDDPPLAAGLDQDVHHRTEINEVPSSSQTTVDEGLDQANRRTQLVDGIDEDDLPEIVSERSLKRKRVTQSKIDIYTGRSSDGTPAKPHRVKDEPLSSPPAAMRGLTRIETMDLDDPAARPLQTASSTYSHTTGSSRHQRSGSAPLSQNAKEQVVQKERGARDRASDVQSRLQLAAAEMRAFSEPMQHHNDQHVLQPLDLNIVAQTIEQTPTNRLKQLGAQHLKHDVLAESGESPPPIDEDGLRLPPSAARARLQRARATKPPHTPVSRLQRHDPQGSPLVKQELTPPSPLRTAPQTPSSSGEAKRSARSVRSNQEDDIVPDGRPVWSLRASGKRTSNAPKRDLAANQRKSPLREKPVNELRIQDFKPNPVYNHGYSYAFTETIRRRGDRMCLPGCTNSECCGSHFRRLAEALDVLPTSQEEEILEEYLGDAYNTVMSTQISADERAELILQARTKKMANESGKHRENYERRKTPPGYWRVDFPSTQEQERDREKAKDQETKMVRERWLEAQREGGRWIFRDE